MADRKIIALATLAALLLLVTGWLWLGRGTADARYAQCQQSQVPGGFAALGGAFTLTDENGQRVTDKQVFDKPSLLYFGYTFCPDVCPMDSARNAAAVDILAEAGQDVKPVMITVDPRRDTPEVLRDFTDLLHPEMVGLTGTEQEIADANRLWRNYYRAQNTEDPDYYLVDHMTNTWLILPNAGTVEMFTRDVTPEAMAERVGCFLNVS
ncbi:MAG: SCO family protein [Paracoccus sp. (in: a-proteobacteria)]|uniref:SCO family protein n=1 Tax=Paracoccus sp. TaxID=267 RepID=UPI0026DFA5EF|nr:SCO family protein [Paracoccus sp. (in: a-proteobacteria)]MDO5621006.1 SCO family protein [Paracoccus sp. (in: a-proteobacteria)]